MFLFIFVYIWGNGFASSVSLETVVTGTDFAVAWQFGFQDSASVLMESIVDLHDYIMFYLLVILGLVVWMLFAFVFFNPNGGGLWKLFTFGGFLFQIAKLQEQLKRRVFFIFHAKVVNEKGLGWMASVRDDRVRPLVAFFFVNLVKKPV